MGRLCSSIKQFHAAQKRYFQLARQEVAERNLRLLRFLSLLTAGLLLFFILVSSLIIRDWLPTVNHTFFLPVLLLICAAANLYARLGTLTSRTVTALCLLFETVLFIFIIRIDVLTSASAPGTFMPLLCVVLPSLFIFPLRLSYSMVALFEVLYVLTSLRFKEPFFAQYDIFNSIAGIAFSLALAFVIARLRVRDHEARLRYQQLSTRDFLTNILNKQSFQEAAQRYLLSCGPETRCALLILDVDDFKQVNDNQGHYGGDCLLRSIGKSLTEIFRATDLVGRFGGDEFIILIKGPITLPALEEKCRQIQQQLSLSQETVPSITCSVGGVVLNCPGVDFETLFRQADAALYQAKRTGKNRCCLELFRQAGPAERAP